MSTESIPLSFLSIFSLISFFVFLIIKKFSVRIGNGVLLDQDFYKPQAFHKQAVVRSGGLAGIISLIIFFILYYFLFQKILVDYLTLSTAVFLLGFSEDIKFKMGPNNRLTLMIVILLFFITYFSVDIQAVDLSFLEMWMQSRLFVTLFVLLCFLFIINGANLIDGFDGLLTIHLLIINSIILFINVSNNHVEFAILIAAQIIILFCFLLFNFPKANMFLGDSGSYLFGSLTALNMIETNNLNIQISSFFFCILFFYLFFEVFFSFFRKILQKKSPLLPDQNHLHMLVYKRLEKNSTSKNNNYLTALSVNIGYLILILPGIYFMENPLISRYWFFILLAFYTLFYLRLRKLNK
jgi:UDP-N-acetylmuramyl pentapeptide phosphotransferase/UDP-N-acetylglucosamine-1-phosphate transferase|tara:strand:+ start:111 stop:1169 length:1059 start_codon:yes stop_codon:yes gene_type:complete